MALSFVPCGTPLKAGYTTCNRWRNILRRVETKPIFTRRQFLRTAALFGITGSVSNKVLAQISAASKVNVPFANGERVVTTDFPHKHGEAAAAIAERKDLEIYGKQNEPLRRGRR